jgi:glucokinase-like ROK family protein
MSSRLESAGKDLSTEARGRPLSDSVLELIWLQQQISRAEIARRTGLSRSTVSDIVAGLLETGLVAEVGDGPSRGGRRPILLAFQDDALVILGVDMGASHVSVALTDLRGRVVAWEHRDHPVRSDPDGTGALIVELCDACLRAWGGTPRHLLGIGVAVPSPVDPQRPELLSEIALPAWRGRSGLEGLKAQYDAPVFVDNDANLGALAERWWGAGRGIDDFAYIKVATGIGAGFMIRGEIYRGAGGVAGEIGHVTIDADGPICSCGNRGCLGTFVGSEALTSRARSMIEDFPDSFLAGGEITMAAIEDAALAGDELCRLLVDHAAVRLGVAIADVINLMNPSAVILGGSLSRLGDLLILPLREAAVRRTFVSSLAAVDIRASQLGEKAIAVGAATLVLDRALADPSLFPRPS